MKGLTIIILLLVNNGLLAQNHKKGLPAKGKPVENSFLGDTLNMLATKFVLVDKDVITNVDHNFDGSWNFWSDGRRYDPETALKKVQFNILLKLDKTILQLSKMPPGYYARRKSKNLPWKIERFKVKN